MALHPSEWYNSAQAAIGLDPAQRGISGVASKTDPLFKKGLSFEQMSKQTGVPVAQIRSYAAKAYPTYGVKSSTNGSKLASNFAPASGSGSGFGGSQGDDPAAIAATRGQIHARASDIMHAYDALFGQLDAILKDKAAKTESDYGDQFATTSKNYTDSIPEIQKSYAAIGSGDSTDQSDAKDKAHEGFVSANQTIQKNKDTDLAAIGNYGATQRSKYGADRDSVNRLVSRSDADASLASLQGAQGDLDNKLGSIQADTGALTTDSGARGQLSALTADNGRFDSVRQALDTVVKSSMSGSVKQAAVQAVVDSAGLSDLDKQKVKQLYGNVYDTPVAA